MVDEFPGWKRQIHAVEHRCMGHRTTEQTPVWADDAEYDLQSDHRVPQPGFWCDRRSVPMPAPSAERQIPESLSRAYCQPDVAGTYRGICDPVPHPSVAPCAHFPHREKQSLGEYLPACPAAPPTSG